MNEHTKPQSAKVADSAEIQRDTPGLSSPEAEAFYLEILRELVNARLPFLVAGGYAVAAYTGVRRATKDFDVFTTPGDFPRILSRLQERGHTVTVKDERWIAKVHRGQDFVDVIFCGANGLMPVQEDWFAHARRIEVLGVKLPILSPTELVWSKVFIQNRHRYDGADIVNIILKQHGEIDWRRLLSHMDAHWEVLLAHLLNFRWVYPSERDHVPRWLLDELIGRLQQQLTLPLPETRICRGRMFSRIDYRHAVEEWGFVDTGDDGEFRNG
jgi:hypothetical protein